MSHPFENGKFMIGLAQGTSSFNRSCVQNHTKITAYNFTYANGEYQDIEEVPLELWNETHFPASVFDRFRPGIGALWFPSSNLSLQGSRFSSQAENFLITVGYTPNDECGMTFQEYVQEANLIEFNFLISNEYIDPKNTNDPIQIATKDQFYHFIETDTQIFSDIYIKK